MGSPTRYLQLKSCDVYPPSMHTLPKSALCGASPGAAGRDSILNKKITTSEPKRE